MTPPAATDPAALLDALAWQVELGADEAIAEAPIDRFAESAESAATAPAPPAARPRQAAPRASEGATRTTADARPGPAAAAGGSPAELAAGAATLEELAEAVRGWQGSPLRLAARNLVFADGHPGARVMLVGEAPGAEEDRQGKPFVGASGRLLDLMLAAIGLGRHASAPEDAAYIANILPWRPPGNRSPSDDEVAQFLPFLERHIALAQPEVIVTLGGVSTKHLLGVSQGITRLRGRWARHEPSGLPLLPTLHPAFLLRSPAQKRLAWRDLLALRAFLDGEAP
ncbi:MAG TPA: uracil-DNA glycosylase [Thermohalobaculum sp.]|nr:uracil-DNA glycosylase [Thermohalobaculum sp.]